jgi:hypothetical protein
MVLAIAYLPSIMFVPTLTPLLLALALMLLLMSLVVKLFVVNVFLLASLLPTMVTPLRSVLPCTLMMNHHQRLDRS